MSFLGTLLVLRKRLQYIIPRGAISKHQHHNIGNDEDSQDNIPFNVVSRQESNLNLSYNELNEDIFKKRVLIVNCTPLGTYPDIKKCPQLPYELINKENILFDLVYNPSETLFMKKGKEIGCKTLNGYQMLRLQAEKSWEIWADYIKQDCNLFLLILVNK